MKQSEKEIDETIRNFVAGKKIILPNIYKDMVKSKVEAELTSEKKRRKAYLPKIAVAVVVFAVVFVAVQTDASTPFSRIGERIAAIMRRNDSSQEIYKIEGIPVTRGEVRIEVESRMTKGLEKEEAIRQTVEDLVEKKALYARAKVAGYTVSDKEFKEYQAKLRESVQKSDNMDDIEAYYQGFGGEAEYWKDMEPVIRQNLVIRKYLDSAEFEGTEEQLREKVRQEAYQNMDAEALREAVKEVAENVN